jgi:hypothetical protein
MDGLVHQYQRWDRNINIFLAVASSGSIAAWAIWQFYPELWGGIIASSQVLTVLKPYLPYYKYVKEFNIKNIEMNNFMINIERLWHDIQNSKITEKEVEDIYFSLKKNINEVLSFNDDIFFKVSSKIEKEANNKMKKYLLNNFGIEININSSVL